MTHIRGGRSDIDDAPAPRFAHQPRSPLIAKEKPADINCKSAVPIFRSNFKIVSYRRYSCAANEDINPREPLNTRLQRPLDRIDICDINLSEHGGITLLMKLLNDFLSSNCIDIQNAAPKSLLGKSLGYGTTQAMTATGNHHNFSVLCTAFQSESFPQGLIHRLQLSLSLFGPGCCHHPSTTWRPSCSWSRRWLRIKILAPQTPPFASHPAELQAPLVCERLDWPRRFSCSGPPSQFQEQERSPEFLTLPIPAPWFWPSS